MAVLKSESSEMGRYLDYPATGTWVGCGASIITSEDSCITFGLAGDVPIVGNW